MDDLREEAQRFAELHHDELYGPTTGVNLSTGYATLKIDMTLMTEDERVLVYEAENLLKRAGVVFDASSGKGFRNWDLDWSLSGATVETRPLQCSALDCHQEHASLWAVYEVSSSRTLKYAYCSASCRDKDAERVASELGWRCLVRL